MTFILALDQGTTSSRAIVFDHAGEVKSLAQEPFAQIYPRPGWVEHDPAVLWQSQLSCARRALESASLKASDINAIGITNQRETTILWDRRTGAPLDNALVWQDRRTATWCDAQRAHRLDLVKRTTGLVIDPYFSASKLVWLLDTIPGARQRAEAGELAFGTVDSWLLWQLTGGAHLTDTTNASRTLLYDIHRQAWSQELLDVFNVPKSLLAEVRPSSGDFGKSTEALFGAPIRICSVVGDQQAALFGQGCFGPGAVKNTYGTGCFMLMHTGEDAIESKNGLLTTGAATVGATSAFALEGSVFSAGSAVQWLRDELRIIENASDVESLAQSVDDTGGMYLVPAFNGLGSPQWDASARGTIVGITRGTNRGHFALATLESIALQSAELLLAMQSDADLEFSELRADGGASVNNLLMQLQADLLGVPVIRPHIQETTALGAANLAALALGWWDSASELVASRRQAAKDVVFTPRRSRDWAESKRAAWSRAVQRSLAWSTEEDSSLQ